MLTITHYFNVVQYCTSFIVHLESRLLQRSVCILYLYKVNMHIEKSGRIYSVSNDHELMKINQF